MASTVPFGIALWRFVVSMFPLGAYMCHSWVLEGSLAGNCRVGFRLIFGQTWPPTPSRSMGLVLQCRLYQKSAQETNSKAIKTSLKPYYFMLRNNASGPQTGLPGRILTGLLPGKHQNRPSGRPKAGRGADFGTFPVAVRPKSGPEGRFWPGTIIA